MYDYDNAEKVHRGPPGIKWLEPTDSLEGQFNSTDPDDQVGIKNIYYLIWWNYDGKPKYGCNTTIDIL